MKEQFAMSEGNESDQPKSLGEGEKQSRPNLTLLESGQNPGALLKAAREKKGLTASEVSALTKINIYQLMAIEAGDLSKLPPATFAKAFIKSYCRVVELDAEVILAGFGMGVPGQPAPASVPLESEDGAQTVAGATPESFETGEQTSKSAVGGGSLNEKRPVEVKSAAEKAALPQMREPLEAELPNDDVHEVKMPIAATRVAKMRSDKRKGSRNFIVGFLISTAVGAGVLYGPGMLKQYQEYGIESFGLDEGVGASIENLLASVSGLFASDEIDANQNEVLARDDFSENAQQGQGLPSVSNAFTTPLAQRLSRPDSNFESPAFRAPSDDPRVEQASLQAELAEQRRLQAERQTEQARFEAERAQSLAQAEAQRAEQALALAEQERQKAELAVEKAREQALLETERAEQARLLAEQGSVQVRQQAEKVRQQALLDAQKAEQARVEAEQESERARIEAEKAREQALLEAKRAEEVRVEAERQMQVALLEAQQAREKALAEAQRAEQARQQAQKEAEQVREQARLEAEQAEKARLEAEQQTKQAREQARIEAERAEKARLQAQKEAEEAQEQARLEAERAEMARLKVEREAQLAQQKAQAEAERAEQARLVAEQEAQKIREQARLGAERAEQARLQAEKEAQQAREQARLEAERAEQARLQAEKEAQQAREQARLEAERAEQARLQAEKETRQAREQARIESERAEQARLQAENAREQARLEAQRAEKARLEAEKMRENAKLEAQKAREEASREAELAERARLEAEKALKEAKLEIAKAEKARKAAEQSRRSREEVGLSVQRALAQAKRAEEKRLAQIDSEMRRYGRIRQTPASAAQAAAAPARGGASNQTVSGNSVLRMLFKADSWVTIRDADGQVLMSKLNKGGSRVQLQGKAPFKVIIGQADSVSVFKDGRLVNLTPHIRGKVARLSIR